MNYGWIEDQRIRYAAFELLILTVWPDYVINIRRDILKVVDGPC